MNDLFEAMKRFQREMNKLFDSFFGSRLFAPKLLPDFRGGMKKNLQLFREPLSDVRETDRAFIASLEIPGVEKKDIHLQVTDHALAVKVEKKAASRIERKGYVRAERSYKGFYRSIPLPSTILPERAEALYNNGVLKVTLPKAHEKKRLGKAKIITVR